MGQVERALFSGQAFRFLHAADLHLDSPFKGLSGAPESVRAALRESTFGALDAMVELAVAEQVDFVVIAGDLYETADRSLRAQVRLQQAMERLAERRISAFVVHGNHDPLDGRGFALRLPAAVHVFPAGQAEKRPVVLPDRGHVADVWGISYPTAAVRDNYACLFAAKAPGAPFTIGLLHANVGGDGEHADYAPCTLQDLAASGIDYWALGHVHTRRVLSETPWAVYPGNVQGRSIRETGPKGCYVVDVDESGAAKLKFHPLDRVRWQHRTVSVEGLAEVQELKDRLEQELQEAARAAEGRPVLLRLELTGRSPLHRLLGGGADAASGLTAELTEELRTVGTNGSLGAGSWMDTSGAEGSDRAEGQSAGSRQASSTGCSMASSPQAAEAFGSDPFVWLEALKVRTAPLLDLDALALSDGLAGDVLRLADELLRDSAQLDTFAAETLGPLAAHPKAGALLRRSGLQRADGAAPEEAAEWVRAAALWLAEQLAGQEEGA